MNEFEVKLDKLVRQYINKSAGRFDEGMEEILLAISDKFLDLYANMLLLSKIDIEKKIYNVNNFFNICKQEVISILMENQGRL